MREVLFRGKRKDIGEWVEGSLLIDERGNHYIGTFISHNTPRAFISKARSVGKTKAIFTGMGFREVDPETVGQWTGLHDSTKWEELTEKEREEFTRDGNFPSEWKGKKIFEGDVVKAGKVVRSIRFRNGAFEITGKTSGISMYQMVGTDLEYEVIGNIYDNPELLQMEG